MPSLIQIQARPAPAIYEAPATGGGGSGLELIGGGFLALIDGGNLELISP